MEDGWVLGRVHDAQLEYAQRSRLSYRADWIGRSGGRVSCQLPDRRGSMG